MPGDFPLQNSPSPIARLGFKISRSFSQIDRAFSVHASIQNSAGIWDLYGTQFCLELQGTECGNSVPEMELDSVNSGTVYDYLSYSFSSAHFATRPVK